MLMLLCCSVLDFCRSVAAPKFSSVSWRAGAGTVSFNPSTLSITSITGSSRFAAGAAKNGPGAAAAAGPVLFAVRVWQPGPGPSGWALRSTLVDPTGWVLDASRSAAPLTFVYTHSDAMLLATLTAHDDGCTAALEGLCDGARRASVGNCWICKEVHQHALTPASCSAAELFTFCTGTKPAHPAPTAALRLQLNVTNMAASSIKLAEVTFPDVGGVRATGIGMAGGELVSGGGVRGTGLRVENIGVNLSTPRLRWYDHGYAISYVYQDAYPHASTNWLALADSAGALYFGVHEDSLSLTSMRLSNNSAACTPVPGSFCVALTANSSVTLPPQSTWSRTIALAYARDDSVTGTTPFSHWSLAARIYRSWFDSVFAAPKLPGWATGGYAISGIDASGDREFYGERETEVDDPFWFGSSHLIVWGTSAIPQCCPGYPIPDPGRGGAPALMQYAQRLRDAGMSMATYFESQRSNPVFSSAASFRGQEVAALPPHLRPPPLSQLMKYAKHNNPALPAAPMQGNYQKLVAEYNKQNGSHNDVVQYFNLELNGTELHVLYPQYNDVDGWFNSYLAGWMTQLGATGVAAPYCDQMGFDPEVPDFGPSAWGDGTAGKRMHALMKQGGPAANAYSHSSMNGSWGFTYEGYTGAYPLTTSCGTAGYL